MTRKSFAEFAVSSAGTRGVILSIYDGQRLIVASLVTVETAEQLAAVLDQKANLVRSMRAVSQTEPMDLRSSDTFDKPRGI